MLQNYGTDHKLVFNDLYGSLFWYTNFCFTLLFDFFVCTLGYLREKTESGKTPPKSSTIFLRIDYMSVRKWQV